MCAMNHGVAYVKYICLIWMSGVLYDKNKYMQTFSYSPPILVPKKTV